MSVRVRVGGATYSLGPLQCPRCRKLLPAHDETYGIARKSCSGKRCRASWVAIRIPPGVIVRQLVDIVSPDVARALLDALTVHMPRGDSRIAFAQMPLEFLLPDLRRSDVPFYLQSEPDSPEPFMGWRKAEAIMSSLYRESA